MNYRKNATSPLSIPFIYAFLNSDKMNCVEDSINNTGAIYVGSLDAANDKELLKKNDIRAVLTVASNTGSIYSNHRSLIFKRSQYGLTFSATSRRHSIFRYFKTFRNGHQFH
jgi:hypothetical protein